MHAVFLDYETVSHGELDPGALKRAVERADEAGELTLLAATPDDEIAARIARAEIVLTNKVRLGAAQLEAAPLLKLVALSATGTDNIELAAAAARGIAVCNVRNYATASVVQHVWSLILALTQHLPEYQRFVAGGGWRSGVEGDVLQFPIRELAGRTIGIVGYGALGRGVAAAAAAFGLRILIAERAGSAVAASSAPTPGRVPLETLLRESDIVSLHCPLTPATRGLIGARELGLMKRDALLINTARGGLIDGAALARALESGHLGGAALDVLAQEPPGADDPLLAPGIARLIVTPHIAWAAREARRRLMAITAANIAAFLRGEPINVVN